MVLAANGGVWIDGHPGEDWIMNNTNNSNNGENNYQEIESRVEDMAMAASLSNFKPMLDSDWYVNQDFQTLQNHPEVRELGFCSNPAENTILHHSIDSSATCSPSQPFALDPSQSHHLFPQKSSFPSLLNVSGINPFDSAFDFPSETSFLGHFQPNQASNLVGFTQNQMGNPEFNLVPHFQPDQPDGNSCLGSGFNVGGIEGFDGSNTSDLFTNRAKLLKPLEVFPSIGSPPTLFQKRAAMRQSSGDKLENLEISGLQEKRDMEDGEAEGASIEISGFNYDSEELNLESKLEESTKNGGSCSNANSTVTGGDRKGKKKGMPAKNLMAERRRRKKLNDRLFMLRTAVPRISKMDRASILGDAIDYLKELLQKINDLHNELESNPPVPLVAPSTSFHPLTPTPSTLSCLVKEELCPSSFPSPKNQPAKVEVRVRDGGAVNIHMFCARRPGLLLSTMKSLDSLGIDIQQAVISCFNGFALDVFRAEQCREGQGQHILPEQIKAVLLDSAGFHGMV